MMKCNKCDAPAEYNSPGWLCGEHWAKWMAYNLPEDEFQMTVRQQYAHYKEVMRIVNRERRKEMRECKK